MTEAVAEIAVPKRGLMQRLLLPALMLLGGVGGGFAAAHLLPPYVAALTAPKAPQPQPSPLQYVSIDNSFTANLKDSGRFVQVQIAVSTQGGQVVVDMVERHHLAIVAAVLDVLAATTETELQQPGGRGELARRMRVAINELLQRKSGLAGVDEVYLTSFVLQ